MITSNNDVLTVDSTAPSLTCAGVTYVG